MKIRQGVGLISIQRRTIDTRNRGIGLGDLAWVFTKITGLAILSNRWHKWRGTFCGCQARRKKWNQVRLMSPIAFAWERNLCWSPEKIKLSKPGQAVHAPIMPEELFGEEHLEEVI